MFNQVYVIINKATGELWSRGENQWGSGPVRNAWTTSTAAKNRFSHSVGIKFDLQDEYEIVELVQYYSAYKLTEQSQQLNMGD